VIKSIKIENHLIGSEHKPFIIAEMSGNHNQSIERSFQIVEAAALTGCHALKLQTFKPGSLTIDCDKPDFIISDPGSLWADEKLYDLYEKVQTPWEWHKPIFEKCRELGLIPFSSPFDEEAVDFLEELDCPVYKIASFENGHIPLIRKVAKTKKPIIISTGMATEEQLGDAVNAVREEGNDNIILLKCTSAYPSDARYANLATIPHMRDLFDCNIGLSDHTLGIGVAIAAVTLGATVIEKHFTLQRSDGGIDSAFSMEPDEMKMLVEESVKAKNAGGEVSYGPTKSEEKSTKFRRSIYIVEDIGKGGVLTEENIKIIRPGFGIEPVNYTQVLGRKALADLERGEPLSWDKISDQ